MRIVLNTFPTTTAVDLTARIREEGEIVFTDETERTRFERVVGDVEILASNSDGYFTSLFATTGSRSRWTLELWSDTRRLFFGEVPPDTIRFDYREESVRFSAFSLTRRFWDRAKNLRLYRPRFWSMGWSEDEADVLGGSYTTVEKILRSNFALLFASEPFAGFSVDSRFASRLLRYRVYLGDTAYPGSTGRYVDLEERTLQSELLEAFSLYYNAEFFVDPESLVVKMIPRESIVNDTRHDLESVLIEDAPVEVQWLDEEKVDALHLAYYVGVPNPPVVKSVRAASGGPPPGDIYWKATFVYRDPGGYEIESPPSEASDVFSNNISINLRTGSASYQAVTLTIPVGSSYAVARRIYRLAVGGNAAIATDWIRVAEIRDNTTTEFEDTVRQDPTWLTSALTIPDAKTLGAWITYDESSGLWNAPIPDDNQSNTPTGRIFEVFPKLTFYAPTDHSKTRPPNALDVISFFGRESSIETLKAQWLDLFRTRRKIRCTVQGIDYRVGDTAISPTGLFPNDATPDDRYLVKKVRANVTRETTELELVSL